MKVMMGTVRAAHSVIGACLVTLANSHSTLIGDYIASKMFV